MKHTVKYLFTLLLAIASCGAAQAYDTYFTTYFYSASGGWYWKSPSASIGSVKFGQLYLYDYGGAYYSPQSSSSYGLCLFSANSGHQNSTGTVAAFYHDTSNAGANYASYGYYITDVVFHFRSAGWSNNLMLRMHSDGNDGNGSGNDIFTLLNSGWSGSDWSEYRSSASWTTYDYEPPVGNTYAGVLVSRGNGESVKNAYLEAVYVYYNRPDLSFSETYSNAHMSYHQSDCGVDVTSLTHTATSGKWQLFCPPYSSFPRSRFGSSCEVYKFSSVAADRIVLQKYTSSTLSRNTVYLIRPSQNVSGATSKNNVTLFTKDTQPSTGSGGYTLMGTYCLKDLSTETNVFYFKNDMYDQRQIRGMRGYFKFPAGVANARDIPWVVEDEMGNTTAIKGIEEIRQQIEVKSSPYANNIYDINGQQQASNLQQLRRGIYIRNGKKFLRQ